MNARSFFAGPDLEAHFFLAGADDVEAGPDEAGLLDGSPPLLPLPLLLPLPCRCSVAEVVGGAIFYSGWWHCHLSARPIRAVRRYFHRDHRLSI